MIKTNSKAFRENLRKFIIDNFNFEEYQENNGIELTHDFDSVKLALIETFNAEKYYSDSYALAHHIRPSIVFRDWVTGLPTYFSLNCIAYGDSVNELGNLLEQTETERAKYTDTDSMNLLIDLIYRELTR